MLNKSVLDSEFIICYRKAQLYIQNDQNQSQSSQVSQRNNVESEESDSSLIKN